jgi:cysteine desulfurase family protein
MIYFDNAATTFPKPSSVSHEVYRCLKYYCGNPGRGAHPLSVMAAKKVYECRAEAAELFGADTAEKVIFTQNTTHALNLAIKGFLHIGDHVLISDMEHNAVLRPLRRLSEAGLIKYDMFPSYSSSGVSDPKAIIDGINARIKPNTSMIVTAHASNICSSFLPVEMIGTLCRIRGFKYIVDAAASAGHLPLDIGKIQADAICAPGHKGLYGPQGSGLMILRNNIPETLIEGGNGVNSLDTGMSDILPERFEAGTLNTPAIAGLSEGIKEIRRIGISEIHGREVELYRELRENLENMPNVKLYAPQWEGHTLLFNINGCDADEVGRLLSKAQICVRSGYHCAPLAHSTLETDAGGAVRVSFGMYNTKKEIYILCDEINKIAKGLKK